MEDLLKEAIADAKAVRETAIENAKLALEEAFTPTIQSMLSKKLQAEMSEDDEEMEDEEDVEDEEEAPEEGHYSEDDEDPSDEFSDEEAPEEEDEVDDEVDESEVIEINGVKYIPLVSEEDDEEEMGDEEEDEMEDEELDLEAIIRELEDELDEAKDEDEDEEVDEAKETDEVDEAKDTEEVDESKSKEEEVDESDDVDLEEVIKAIEEEEKEEEKVNELETVKSELDEYREAVKVLRGQLSEVNMLNAKLLFTNKLFRAFGLSEAQKVKVIETFDRAKNIREVKLVYSTLAESFGSSATPVNESFKKKGSASKVQASTKSAKADKVITEGTEMRDRFKKLANIL
jgi:hypothetical protein